MNGATRAARRVGLPFAGVPALANGVDGTQVATGWIR